MAEQAEAGDVGDGVRRERPQHVGRAVVEHRHPPRRLGDVALPREHEPGAERLRQEDRVARPGAALRPDAVGMDGADDREPVLRLGVADRVAAGEDRARRAHLFVGGREDRATTSVGSSSGKAAIESASSGVPPIANTSLSAFVAAIRPKSAGSSTSGGKKSSVKTSARSSSSL